jgi:hypothetical protein
LFRQSKEQALAAQQPAISTSKERFEILLCFYDTYTDYYIHINLLGFCCGSPAPLISIILQMTMSFKNKNINIVYALEKIICFARDNQYIILAQRIWWIASVIRLQPGLIIFIDNLKAREFVTEEKTNISKM